MTYFNGSTCSLLDFFDHTIQGEEKEELPKWGGTNEIETALTKTTDTVNEVQTQCSTLYGTNYTDLKTSKEEIQRLLENFVEYYSVTPPFSTEIPEYLDELNNLLDSNSLIGKVSADYTTTVAVPFEVFKQLKDPLESIASSSSLSGNLNSASKNVKDLGDAINNASDLIANNFVDLQDTISNYIVLIFNIIFGFFIAVSGGIIALVVLFVFMKYGFLKIVIHIFWNVSFIFLFGSLMVGGVLGIVSLIGGQIAPVLSYILSPQYLNSNDCIIPGGQQSSSYINTCLNSDGNLLPLLPIPSLDEDNLNLFYNLSQKIELLEQNMIQGSQSTAAQNMLDTLTSYYNDLGIVKIKGGSTIAELMQGCGLTTDRSAGATFVVDYCSTSSPSNPSCNLNSHCTFVTKVNEDLINLLNINGASSPLSQDFTALRQELDKGIGLSKDQLTDTKKLTGSMIDAFGSMLGETGSFSDLLNCGFLKEDLIVFCDQFSHIFSSTSNSLCYICAFTSIFSFIGVFFVGLTLSGYKNVASQEGIFQASPKKIEMTSFNPGSSEIIRVIK